MQLTLWTYEGPSHVGAMRVAASMSRVHLVLHAPQGDSYADLLFTMIERGTRRPPVTYTTFQARDLGSDSATLLRSAVMESHERFRPDAILVAASCTAELLQDDPGGIARSLGLPIPVLPLELSAYQRKENWGAAETFYALVRAACGATPQGAVGTERNREKPVCNILGPTSLGFRNRDDVTEIVELLGRLRIAINVVAPLGATYSDLSRLPAADFNVLLYPETGQTTAEWLYRRYGQPYTRVIPIGVTATRKFIQEVAHLSHANPEEALRDAGNLSWHSRSVDSNYLTGKRVFVFGDASHVIAAAQVAAQELGFTVVGLGTYSREHAREVRNAASRYELEALISDDYLAVETEIARLRPDLVLGTQMERHVAKRLGIPCAVISAPAHVQDFPARYSPQMGFEGANVLFDTWVHPLMMGLEEHLLNMFRDDFEFSPAAAPSHLVAQPEAEADQSVPWAPDAERELRKIPFFVRTRARRNTERFAQERQIPQITLDTLYEAKSHFSR